MELMAEATTEKWKDTTQYFRDRSKSFRKNK